MKEKDKIIQVAQNYFIQNGFYKTTMDELASLLKMSKKTIYKYFSTKDDLVKEIVLLFIKTHNRNVMKILSDDSSNAIEKFHNMIEYIGKFIANVGEKWLTDLENYRPELWEEIDSFRSKLMHVNLTKIIKQGKSEGFFIDRPEEIIVAVFISTLRGVVNPDFIMRSRFSLFDALNISTEILMNGILTQSGLKEFEKIKNRDSK